MLCNVKEGRYVGDRSLLAQCLTVLCNTAYSYCRAAAGEQVSTVSSDQAGCLPRHTVPDCCYKHKLHINSRLCRETTDLASYIYSTTTEQLKQLPLKSSATSRPRLGSL